MIDLTAQQFERAPKRGKNLEWLPQFEGQTVVSGLLAKALYGPPDRDWLNALIDDGVLTSVPLGLGMPEMMSAIECLARWLSGVQRGLTDEAFDALCDDYTRLFVGPGRLLAAPWESVHTNKDRAIFQMETLSVKNWYQRFELALASEYNEPADHIGLEFAFLADLSARTVEATEIRDGREVKRLVDAQRGFIGQHLLRWVPLWADDVDENARTDFYRGLAWLARGVVREAASFLAVVQSKSVTSGPFRRE
jgi:putative dimethyl sulfoxide reductase chaperone